MEHTRFRECLEADCARLAALAASGRLDAAVPSCPDWTLADLVTHVAEVYLHVVETMRVGHEPVDWAPEKGTGRPPEVLARAYADLVGEFDARDPSETAATWYPAGQTVGFWIRRMAQETAVHRADAELAVGDPLTPVPGDLAMDGVDEALVAFLDSQSKEYREWPPLPEALSAAEGDELLIRTGGQAWLVQPRASGVEVVQAGP